jgi:hypothetical protein
MESVDAVENCVGGHGRVRFDPSVGSGCRFTLEPETRADLGKSGTEIEIGASFTGPSDQPPPFELPTSP